MKKSKPIGLLLIFTLLILVGNQRDSHASSFWDYIHNVMGDEVNITQPIYSDSTEEEVKDSLRIIKENTSDLQSDISGDLDLYFQYSFYDNVAILTWKIHAEFLSDNGTGCWNYVIPWYPQLSSTTAAPDIWEEPILSDLACAFDCENVTGYEDCEIANEAGQCFITKEADYAIYRIVNGSSQLIEYLINGPDYGWFFDYVNDGYEVSFYDSLHDVPSGATVSYSLESDIQKYVSDCMKDQYSNSSVTKDFDGDGDGWADFADPGVIFAPVFVAVVSNMM